MSDRGGTVQRWELPSFEPPPEPAAPVDLQQELAEARARGHAEGLQQGLSEGLEEARQRAARVTEILEQLSQPYRNLDQVVTLELARMSMQVARQILERELKTDSSCVTQAVEQALATLTALVGDIEITLNPADIDLLQELTPDALEGKSWKLREDAALLPGGCRIKTPVSYVDASMERQLEQVFSSLIEAFEDNQAP